MALDFLASDLPVPRIVLNHYVAGYDYHPSFVARCCFEPCQIELDPINIIDEARLVGISLEVAYAFLVGHETTHYWQHANGKFEADSDDSDNWLELAVVLSRRDSRYIFLPWEYEANLIGEAVVNGLPSRKGMARWSFFKAMEQQKDLV